MGGRNGAGGQRWRLRGADGAGGQNWGRGAELGLGPQMGRGAARGPGGEGGLWGGRRAPLRFRRSLPAGRVGAAAPPTGLSAARRCRRSLRSSASPVRSSVPSPVHRSVHSLSSPFGDAAAVAAAPPPKRGHARGTGHRGAKSRGWGGGVKCGADLGWVWGGVEASLQELSAAGAAAVRTGGDGEERGEAGGNREPRVARSGENREHREFYWEETERSGGGGRGAVGAPGGGTGSRGGGEVGERNGGRWERPSAEPWRGRDGRQHGGAPRGVRGAECPRCPRCPRCAPIGSLWFPLCGNCGCWAAGRRGADG